MLRCWVKVLDPAQRSLSLVPKEDNVRSSCVRENSVLVGAGSSRNLEA